MKNIIITGASRGIGHELAKKFLLEDHRVLAIARTEEKLQTLVTKENKDRAQLLALDLGQTENISKEILKEISDWEKVDVLVNNAGLLIKKPFLELSTEDFQKSLNVNFLAPIKLIQSILPKCNDSSHIVNISTMGAIQGSVKFPELSAYGTSKAALTTLTELLAEELKETGVSINNIALGAVQTQMLEEAFPGYKAPLNADKMAQYIYDFALTGNQFFNGKTLQASSSTP